MEKRPVETEVMPAVALRGLVLFPKMVLHFDIGRDRSVGAMNDAMEHGRQIFLVAQRDVQEDNPDEDGLYTVGTVAQIKQIVRNGSGLRVMAEGMYRARMVRLTQTEPYLTAEVRPLALRRVPAAQQDYADALMRTVRDQFEKYTSLSPKMPKEMVLGIMLTQEPNMLAEFVAGNLPIACEDKQEILEESSVLRRLEILTQILDHENEMLRMEKEISDRVHEQIDENQREYYLREQMKVISEELGDEESPSEEVQEYLDKIAALNLSTECAEKLTKEAQRLYKMPSNSPEAAVVRGYLDTCLELPWNKESEVNTDVAKARQILEHDHYGMKKVKERIIESVAVYSLAPEQKGQILCLVGPPGVGKTSVAQSIARATGREYVRVSLGGVKDESDIRGHRKTYIGSMPGRIMDALRRAGTKNPLLLLDEVDKLGGDYKGDPSSALLEVLDAEQNHAFRDHFIELPFDLSKVLFIATANQADAIPAPLYDRMEVIELHTYTPSEKLAIAKHHLVPKQLKRHGLNKRMLKITDDAINEIISGYTRESGVRNLEREIASICRKSAKNIVENDVKSVCVDKCDIEPLLGLKKFIDDALIQSDLVGVTNGLAYTEVGGDMLKVEVLAVDGSGKIELTGTIGDVMKESAHIAVTYVRAHADEYGIDKNFYKTKDIHIHIPEGAVPKDGPSAGVTLTTSLVSALSGLKVRHDIAMTGEITLTGRVLPIGGLREKSTAAYTMGIRTLLIPKENMRDIAELDEVVRNEIKFIPCETLNDVLSTALVLPTDNAEVQCGDTDEKKETIPNVLIAQNTSRVYGNN